MEQCKGYIYRNVYLLLNSLWDCKPGISWNRSDIIIFHEVSSTVLNYGQRKQIRNDRIAIVKA